LEKKINTYESSTLNEGEEEWVARDPADLMFATEIDVESKAKQNSPRAERFEDRLNQAHTQKSSLIS